MEHAEKQTQVRQLVTAGVLAALGCAATMALQVPSPTGGYVNLGDAVVLLGAYLLGPAYGAAAGGLGPAMADLLSGYAVYVPATLLIKGVMALLAAGLYRTIGRTGGGLLACGLAAETVMVLGYWLFGGLLAAASGGGSFGLCLTAAAAGIPGNLAQGIFGTAASALLVLALRRSASIRRQFPHL
ncbi:MAG: ECF transporter S component [Oscillibacter sp.]|nr:ECF transporter S component [Oscillibacter sp.]